MESAAYSSAGIEEDMLVITVDDRGVVTRADGNAAELLSVPIEKAAGLALEAATPRNSGLLHAARTALTSRPCRSSTVGTRGGIYEVRASPQRDANRRNGALVVATRTIREDAASLVADRTLVGLLAHTPGAVWATDCTLRFTSAIGMLPDGTPLSLWLGKTLEEFLGTAEPADLSIAHHRGALAGERRAYRYEYHGHWFEVVVEPRRDEAATIIGVVGIAIDVTERHRAEERLVESEARLSEAQSLAHLGSWEWSVDSNVLRGSPELFRIAGLDRDRFAGTLDEFLERAHPDDLAAVREMIARALREKCAIDFDYRVVRADGAVRMFHTRADVRLASDGERVERLVGCCWDVTERWDAMRHAEETASLLRATLESTADGLLVIDRSGKVRAANQRFAELWRISPELMATRDDTALLHAVLSQLEDPDGFVRRVEELYAQPGAESFDTVQFADGRTFERYSKAQRLDDVIVGRVWSFRDVSDREHLLRRAVFLADASRLLASLDDEPALEAVARLAVPSLAHYCAIDLMTAQGEPRRLLALSHDDATPGLGEIPPDVLAGRSLLYRADSRSCISVPLVVRSSVVGVMTFGAREGRIYSERDLALVEELARRVQLSLENARLFRNAQEALAAREEFLSIAAHEIRGPITSLHLASQLLQRADLTKDAAARAIAIITREDLRLARFVDELLDVARIRAGHMTFELADVDLTEVVRTVAQRLSADLLRSGSTLAVTAPASVVGVWDRSRVDQVVTNLLSNAIKFGLGRPIELEVAAIDGSARITVRDQGIGIPKDRQSSIFRPFERAVSARHYGGLGLGLYIVRQIVDALGGRISLDSEPGRGTTVAVDLPQRRAEAA